jgi:hypothetical protein
MLFKHAACLAFSLAWLNTGKRMAARMAIIAMTTSNSISVKPNRANRKWRRMFIALLLACEVMRNSRMSVEDKDLSVCD